MGTFPYGGGSVGPSVEIGELNLGGAKGNVVTFDAAGEEVLISSAVDGHVPTIQADGTLAFEAIPAGAAETLAATLSAGNTTGGADIVMTAGDNLRGSSTEPADFNNASAGGDDQHFKAESALATSGGDGGSYVFEPGQKDGAGADGAFLIRQPGGASPNEGRLEHDGATFDISGGTDHDVRLDALGTGTVCLLRSGGIKFEIGSNNKHFQNSIPNADNTLACGLPNVAWTQVATRAVTTSQAAADTPGTTLAIGGSTLDGGAHTAANPNGGNVDITAGSKGSGGAGADGTINLNSQALASVGTAPLPGIAFTGFADDGMYHPADNELGFSTAGVEKLRIMSDGVVAAVGNAMQSRTDLAATATIVGAGGAGFEAIGDGEHAQLGTTVYGAPASFNRWRTSTARGSSAVPTALAADDVMWEMCAVGASSTGTFVTQQCIIQFVADGASGASGPPGRIEWHTSTTGTAAAERMRLNKDGRLLIGATAAIGSELLQVDGEIAITGAFNHDGGTFGALGAAPAAQRAHVVDPTGGATVDAEARTAINAILVTLETFGYHATS